MGIKTMAALAMLSISLSLIMAGMEDSEENSMFNKWKAQHAITYNSKYEEMFRQTIFEKNMETINTHNANKDRTYDMGVNKFTALTSQEFAQMYLLNGIQQTVGREKVEVVVVEELGVEVDWSTKGAVTPVKYQGQCPSPWAFATTGTLEGLSKIAYGQLQQFSEQQLIDCSTAYGNLGCNGGMVDYSFKFVKEKGIATESEYPYVFAKQTCKQPTGSFKISGFVDVSNCANLESSLAERPIAVAVDASNWHAYKEGIFSDCGTKLNHFSLLVGVNAEFWRIKNSWGEAWGEQGYIRLKKGNTCGVCNFASYPVK